MFYDLNVPFNANASQLQATLDFAAELGYNTLALSHTLSGKLPTTIPATPIPLPPPDVVVPRGMSLISRATFTISDASQNHRVSGLQSSYDLLALRPTTEKALSLCCHSLDCDIISLDFSVRLPFILKFKALSAALQRGIRFEICYSAGITGGGTDARRNLISGATALIRASRGRGIIITSEAKDAIGLRGPWDVVNLCAVWGLGQEKGKEGVCEEARKVVSMANARRSTFRGVVGIISGESSEALEDKFESKTVVNSMKRKVSCSTSNENQEGHSHTESKRPLSKKELKRQEKKARMDTAQG